MGLESLTFYQPFTIPVLTIPVPRFTIPVPRFTIPVPRSYYPNTMLIQVYTVPVPCFYYPSTTFLLSQYHVLLSQCHVHAISVPLLYYPSITSLLSQQNKIWPAFVSNSIVGLESLPFYQPFTIPVPIQIDNTQRLSFLRPDSLLHWEQTCQLFKMFIYDMQEHSHEHFRTCANFSSTGLMNTTH